MKIVNTLTENRKGQISMFIIVGLVILVVFLLMFYMLNSLIGARAEREARRTTSSILTTSTISPYTDDCLKEILKQGLITLGKQGGYFYEEQSGYDFVNNELPRIRLGDANVSYLIYPEDGFYNSWWPCPSPSTSNKYTPPTYCRFGPEVFNFDSKYGVGFSNSHLPRLATNRFSIKSQLAKYIEAEMQECVNLTELESFFPGYDLTTGEMDARIIFGVLSVNVELDYPIRMQFQDYEPVIEFYKFRASAPVRLAKIYDIVDSILEKDVFFLKGVPEEEVMSLLRYSPEIKFRKIEAGYDDIYIINDSFALIDGREYTFQFARRNRPPILNYISKSPSYKYDTLDSSKDIYDYLALPVSGLEQVQITANATDPDENDPISYFSQSNTISMNQVTDNSFEYTVSEADVGYHNITIIATDGNFSDLDRQRVRLLIDNILKPNISLYNLYGGDAYSKEDIYFLNASATNKTLDPFATYYFNWYEFNIMPGQKAIQISTTEPCVVLPSDESCDKYSVNIENITDYPYAVPGLDTKTVVLDVNLSYSEMSQRAEIETAVVSKACIPYRNSNSSAYPYNTTDAFFSNHTCCLGDINDASTWQMADANKICYQELRCDGAAGARKLVKNIHCSGLRGNICNGNITDGGISDICGCGGDPDCDNVKANGFTDGVWCYGDPEGCGTACQPGGFREAVDSDNDGIADNCGCSGNVGDPCDGDFDGIFEGKCKGLGSLYSCETN